MKAKICDLDSTDVEKLKARATQLGYSGYVELQTDLENLNAHFMCHFETIGILRENKSVV